MRGLAKRKTRTILTVAGVALSVMFTSGIGFTIGYIILIKEMNTFYQGNIAVISRVQYLLKQYL